MGWNDGVALVAGMITASYLRSILRYDPDTGEWTWIVDRSPRIRANMPAGCVHHSGYKHIKIDNKGYRSAPLAHLYMTGRWPAGEIDHKNRNRSDDRWDNLREATKSENCANRDQSIRRSKTGVVGVYWYDSFGKYVAQIRVRGKLKHLGSFNTIQEATAARKSAASAAFGKFAEAA